MVLSDLIRRRSLRVAVGLLFCFGTITYALANPTSSSKQMAEAANAFVATLDDKSRGAALFPLDSDERATWSNLPIIMVDPRGLLIEDMNDKQRKATHALLRASMSSQGYAKVAGVMWLDDVLRDIEERSLENESATTKDPFRRAMTNSRSSGNYAVAIFGDPPPCRKFHDFRKSGWLHPDISWQQPNGDRKRSLRRSYGAFP
jgi:hypothetical protein